MLSRTEITSRILPSIERHRNDSQSGVNDNEVNDKICRSGRKNIIKRAMLKNSDLQLYLPTMITAQPKQILSSFEKESMKKKELLTEAKSNDKEVKPQIHTSDISARRELAFQECRSKDYLNIKEKFMAAKEKLQYFKQEIPKPKEGKANFNLKELTRKVKLITKSVKLNLKAKDEITLRYRLHSIANKKDSRPVEEFLRLEKSIENLSLQKLILNIEYDNVVNQRKKKKLTLRKKDYIHKPNKSLTNTKAIDSFNEDEAKSSRRLYEPSHSKSYLHSKRSVQSSRSRFCHKQVLITEVNKKARDSVSFDPDHFFKKYGKCLSAFVDEEKSHKDKMVYTSNEIDMIMKSKRDIILDGLKKEYVTKFNESVELKTKIEQKGTELFREIAMKNKEQQQRRVENKVVQAFVQSEIGKTISMRYPIKNYLKDCHFNLYD